MTEVKNRLVLAQHGEFECLVRWRGWVWKQARMLTLLPKAVRAIASFGVGAISADMSSVVCPAWWN